ncbi:MAG: hypothetical protein EBS98_08725 [Chitinophagia bacterium]|nr:hypothetical protein [Chitinophagia bacterium]
MANINDFASSAIECARYIFDSDCEQVSYQEFIRDGNDPRNHILYHAALILGQTEEFQVDINEYLFPPIDKSVQYGTMLS